MALTKEKKAKTIGDFGRKDQDTGSSETQVALLTQRIVDLEDHFKAHPHDENSRHGLIIMVGQRKRHLTYLKRTSPERYTSVVEKLGIRK